MTDFAQRLLHWYDLHGRKQLPWQQPRTPYRVWVSEIMLQQTQVSTVIPYFERFLRRFPDLTALAAAPLDEVLVLWAGLGYYARARNLHSAATIAVRHHGGALPDRLEALQSLPGIGRSTAAAILAQALGQAQPILDANVRRVLCRHALIAGWPGQTRVQNQLWTLAESLLPRDRLADYTQATMDLGSLVCTPRQPSCPLCPLASDCRAHAEGRQTEFPHARPRRERPRRHAHLLLVENDRGELLLERRPPVGIWGGLWSPPVVDADDDWVPVLRQRFGLECEPGEALPRLLHRFTHFDLELRPQRCHARPAPALADAPAHDWTRISDRERLPGLPAPVRKLLEQLYPAPSDGLP